MESRLNETGSADAPTIIRRALYFASVMIRDKTRRMC